jgi:hypothetical protein
VGLKLVYLVVSRFLGWARLSVSDSTAKDVEILMLRHQLMVAQCGDPRLTRKLTWVDRAWLVLLAGLLPVLAENLIRAGQVGCRGGGGLPVGSCVLVCLRFVYLLAVRIVPALGLWRRGDDHKTIEILLLRHQLAVLQWQLVSAGRRPRPDWADRAIIALLVSLVPKARRAGLRLIVTPDTILRWHRDLLRRRWGRQVPPEERPSGHASEHQDPGSAHGTPEPGVGIPTYPR